MPAGDGFFEKREQLGSRASRNIPNDQTPLTPTSLNRLIEQVLKQQLPSRFTLRGEISNFSRHRTSGHLYFSLKDSQACVDCVMFASNTSALRFEPQDGLDVLVTGSVGVYAPRGRYQVYANRIDPIGEGALELAKRQLETKLRAMGLFEPGRKREIPRFPKTIALVTSPQAAGFADMLKILRRFRFLRVMVFPVPVQGSQAAPAIAYALRTLGQRQSDVGGIDVVLLGRGGGSLEDLWAFNEEVVARAVAECAVPVVTGIGHEVDVSIADLIADYHAHTPTEAATVVTAHWRNAVDLLESSRSRLGRILRSKVRTASLHLSSIDRHEFFRKPASILDAYRQRLDDVETRLLDHASQSIVSRRDDLHEIAARLAPHRPTVRVSMLNDRLRDLAARFRRAARARLARLGSTLDARESILRALSPTNVLQRGYTITTLRGSDKVVRSSADVEPGAVLVTRTAQDTIQSTVNDSKQGLLFDNAPKR